jgi:hypothetical protein
MQRRAFMTQSLAASALSLASSAPEANAKRPYFELRRYSLVPGPPMAKLVDSYLSTALIPALNRLGIAPVGAFKLDIGPETPAAYLLLPSTSLDALANISSALAKDAAYVKAAEPFTSVTAVHRIDSALLSAFDDFAPAAPPSGKRIFQLRTYESPNQQAHDNKVAMFQQAEIQLFRNAGFRTVFFGRNLIGERLPALTYMLTFKDQTDLESCWSAFSGDPAWRKLAGMPGNGDDTLIRAITNLILSPKPYSQI